MSAIAVDVRKKALGRGLDALFADAEAAVVQLDKAAATPEEIKILESAERKTLPIASIEPGPFQPRRVFVQEHLDSLADSIREHGVIQPLLVRAAPGQNGRYELIAGERRWRASQIAQLHEVPVIILELPDTTTQELALIENIQRQDLSPLEEAAAYKRLLDEYGYSQDELAKKMGKSRPYITNMIRMLNLPQAIQDMLMDGELSVGQARPLIGHPNAIELAERIKKYSLTARAAEQLVSSIKNKERPVNKLPSEDELQQLIGYHDASIKQNRASQQIQRMVTTKDPDTLALESEMSQLLGLRVSLQMTKDGKGGTVAIEYRSLDQLDELLRRMTMASQN